MHQLVLDYYLLGLWIDQNLQKIFLSNFFQICLLMEIIGIINVFWKKLKKKLSQQTIFKEQLILGFIYFCFLVKL